MLLPSEGIRGHSQIISKAATQNECLWREIIGKGAVSQKMTNNNRLLIDSDGERLKVRNLFGKIERFDLFFVL